MVSLLLVLWRCVPFPSMNMFFLVFGLWFLLEYSEAHSPPISCSENHGRLLELVVDYSWQLSQQAVLCLVPSPSSPSGCMNAHLPDLSTLSSLAQTLFCVFHCHFPVCFWYGDFPMISLRVNAFIFSLVSYLLQLMGCGFYNIGHILCEFSNIISIYRVLHPYHHLVWGRFYRFSECFCMIP